MNCFIHVLTSMTVLAIGSLGEIIDSLPGLDAPLPFKQYSGYITVDIHKGTKLFYWYVESQSNPVKDPLILWLNGGPGCSSLDAVLSELGPFYVKPDTTLGLNKFSWNQLANVLYLESPAGVGFSKSNLSIQYNDEVTATYSLDFLVKFFEMYPHLKTLDFWIAGESYAGHFVPTLAAKVIEYNNGQTNTLKKFNFKGVMIGNPFTDYHFTISGILDFIFSHNLISKDTYDTTKSYCSFAYLNNSLQHFDLLKCLYHQQKAIKELGPINRYDIYTDVCLENKDLNSQNFTVQDSYGNVLPPFLLNIRYRKYPFLPCEKNYMHAYLNQPSVQKAIHSEPTKWYVCNQNIQDTYSLLDFLTSMLPYYNILLKNDLNILIFSGDVDSVIPTTSTRRWIPHLQLPLKKRWHSWMDSKGQVGGYMEIYDKLTFATVRNAGHFVSYFQPRRAFDLFSMFLASV